MSTHEEQMERGTRLVAAAQRWAATKGFDSDKVHYVRTLAAADAAVSGPGMLSPDEMKELIEVLAEVD